MVPEQDVGDGMNEQDRIKLVEAMGWEKQDHPIDRSQQYFKRPDGGIVPISSFDPFIDANDERSIFRHVMTMRFSKRQAFWTELYKIIRVRIDQNVSWPEILMFAEDGDYAHAALKVLE